MKYKFFRIPVADSAQAEAELNTFCTQNKIVSIDRQFVSDATVDEAQMTRSSSRLAFTRKQKARSPVCW